MDHRLFFVIGDLLSNVITGAVVGWISWLMVSPGWNMFVAMFVLMAVGMFVSLLLWIPAGILFGAMEVMLPMMLTGMVSGMFVSMWAAMMPVSATAALLVGGVFGLISIVIVWVINNSVRGVQENI